MATKGHIDLSPGEITDVVAEYMGQSSGICISKRPQSWDFCYQHFMDLDRVLGDRQSSCMQLGYYLASWGMLRGGSYLFKQTNARHYLGVLDLVEQYDHEIRLITPEQFGNRSVQDTLVSLYDDLAAQLLPNGNRSITLVTKVMMGVWGIFPSLDNFFESTFNDFATAEGKRRLFSRFTSDTIEFIGEFYETHQDEIHCIANGYKVVDFNTGEATEHDYPVAKVIDIYGFQTAYNQ